MTKRNKANIKPLRVTQSDIPKVTVQEHEQAQKEDVSLQRLWKEVQDSSDHQTRDKSKYRLNIHKGVLHPIYTTDTTEVKQIMVPTKYREAGMKLAHKSIVGGHLGAKKTDRITSNFHWSGITSDVSRF